MKTSVSMSIFRKRPISIVSHAGGQPVAVKKGSDVVFYCVPRETYARLIEAAEELSVRLRARQRAKGTWDYQAFESVAPDFMERYSGGSGRSVLFHPGAAEEWSRLGAVDREELVRVLAQNLERCEDHAPGDSSSPVMRTVSTPQPVLHIVFDDQPDGVVVWAISSGRLDLPHSQSD